MAKFGLHMHADLSGLFIASATMRTGQPASSARAKQRKAAPRSRPQEAFSLDDEPSLGLKEEDISLLHEQLATAVAAQRQYAARSSVWRNLLSKELRLCERQQAQERATSAISLAGANAQAEAAESKANAIAARATAERRLLREELAVSEQRVVRLCQRLHQSMRLAAVYHAELEAMRAAQPVAKEALRVHATCVVNASDAAEAPPTAPPPPTAVPQVEGSAPSSSQDSSSTASARATDDAQQQAAMLRLQDDLAAQRRMADLDRAHLQARLESAEAERAAHATHGAQLQEQVANALADKAALLQSVGALQAELNGVRSQALADRRAHAAAQANSSSFVPSVGSMTAHSTPAVSEQPHSAHLAAAASAAAAAAASAATAAAVDSVLAHACTSFKPFAEFSRKERTGEREGHSAPDRMRSPTPVVQPPIASDSSQEGPSFGAVLSSLPPPEPTPERAPEALILIEAEPPPQPSPEPPPEPPPQPSPDPSSEPSPEILSVPSLPPPSQSPSQPLSGTVCNPTSTLQPHAPGSCMPHEAPTASTPIVSASTPIASAGFTARPGSVRDLARRHTQLTAAPAASKVAAPRRANPLAATPVVAAATTRTPASAASSIASSLRTVTSCRSACLDSADAYRPSAASIAPPPAPADTPRDLKGLKQQVHALNRGRDEVAARRTERFYSYRRQLEAELQGSRSSSSDAQSRAPSNAPPLRTESAGELLLDEDGPEARQETDTSLRPPSAASASSRSSELESS